MDDKEFKKLTKWYEGHLKELEGRKLTPELQGYKLRLLREQEDLLGDQKDFLWS